MSGTVHIWDAVQMFNNGKGTLLYFMQSGNPAVLVNLQGSFGFCYLGRLNRTPKFRGTTATLAVQNALNAGREVLFTDERPKISTP